MGLLLTRRSENATVTLCHTGTKDLGVVGKDEAARKLGAHLKKQKVVPRFVQSSDKPTITKLRDIDVQLATLTTVARVRNIYDMRKFAIVCAVLQASSPTCTVSG